MGVRLAEHFARYVGIEPDERSAAVAAERLGPLGGIVHSNLERLDDTAPADVLCAFEVLEHIEDDVAALRSWLTHTVPGALVVVSVPADPERYGASDRAVGHYRRYTDADVVNLLRSAGLVGVRHRRYGYPLGYVLEEIRNFVLEHRSVPEPADVPMDERSHGSGRMWQPRPWEGALRSAITAPFRAWQDLRPAEGPGLIATARVPR
jgi:SAM-dependent methyltransferase